MSTGKILNPPSVRSSLTSVKGARLWQSWFALLALCLGGGLVADAAAPTIGAISNQTVVIDRPTEAYHLTVSDAETAELSLVLRGLSSDTNLVPTDNIFFGVAFNTWYLTVTPAFGQTGTNTISVIVRDGQGEEATNSFLFTADAAPASYTRFAQSAPITIPGVTNTAGAASPYPSTNTVSGLTGWITNMTMTFSRLSHERIQDVNMLLVSPGGTGVVLFSEVSGQNRKCTNTTITFDDSVFYALPADFALWSEPLRAANFQSTNFFPGATWTNAPVVLSSFNGASANGDWKLYVYDDTVTNNGAILGGWSLLIATSTGPSISDLANQTILTNANTGPLPFVINDPDTVISNLVLTASSSNTNLVTTNNIVFGGSGTNRTVTVTPNTSQAGTATITITVSDGVNSASDTFVLAVLFGNASPTIAAIPNKTTLMGRAVGPFNITVSDAETSVGSLILTGSSSNTNLVPNSNIILFNSGVQTLTVQPADGLTGTAIITVNVSDGVNVTSSNFTLTVNAPGTGTGIFDNTNSLAIPVAGAATVYPSSNQVSGLSGNITNLTLTLKRLTHSAPHDLEMMLVSPGGQKSVFFSHVGGGTATNVTVTVDDTAFYQLPPSPYAILTGTYQSADFGHGTFPSPAPTNAPIGTNFSPFTGTSPNGAWLLYVFDDLAGAGAGTLAGGWSLAITTDTSNAAPTITAISDKVTTVNTATAAIPFTIFDAETAASNLVLTASSSNTNLVSTNNIVFGGAGTNRTVTLTPSLDQMGSTMIWLSVSDGQVTVSNSFQLFVSLLAAGTKSVTNAATITIPTLGTATPYPSTNNVTGLGGTITNLTARIGGLTHTFVRDVNILLVSPWGQGVRLMEHAGTNNSATGLNLVLSDAAASFLPQNSGLSSGTFKPSAYPTNAIYPGAPTDPYATNMAAFNGVSPNGEWLLYVLDSGPSDSGSISNWSLTIATAISGPQAPTLTDLTNRSIAVSSNTGPIPFTIYDLDTPVANLVLSASSANTNLVTTNNIVFGGTGTNRTVTVTPAAGLAGTATITVMVSDGSLTASNSFLLTVSSPATQVRVETAADGTGTVVPAQLVTTGGAVTVYSVARDAFGNFISNIAASSWSLTNISGGVASSNLVVAGDLKSATFTGVAPGTAKIRATSGVLTPGSSGYLTVYTPGNAAPTIAAITNRITLVGRATGPFNITIGDAETAVGSLLLTGSSSNTNLVPNANIILFNNVVQTLVVQPADGVTGTATITVTVGDGVNYTSTDFDLTVTPPGAATGIYNNTNSISLPLTNVASVYPSTNVVSGLLGNITQVTLTLKRLTHSVPHDLEMMLVGPAGPGTNGTVFFAHVGGGTATNVTVTVDDTAFYQLPPSPYAILTGTYKSADFSHDTFPSPAPVGPYGTDLTPFAGTAPNGDWLLYIMNDPAGTGTGTLAGGWSLAITTDTANTPPTVSTISNQVTMVNTPTAALPFTLFDVETAASNLVLTAASSNTGLVPTNKIVFGGSGTNRTVTVTPTSNQLGSATITLAVNDGLVSVSNNFVLTVNRAPLTVTATHFTRGYGATNPVFTGSVVGLQAGDNITANFTSTATTNSPVGSYPITFTLSDSGGKLGNYTVTTNNGTLTVTNALLTVTANNTNKVYGATLTMGNTNFTVTSGTLFNGNTLTNATLASAGTNAAAAAGSYAITVTSAVGVGSSNYLITYATGTLTVNAASLLITAGSTNKIYGATLNPVDYAATGLVNGDTVTNVTLTSGGSVSNAPVGNHAITAGGAAGTGLTNYTIGYSNGVLTVNAANLLITAGNTNKIYGTTLNPAAFTVTGLLNGNTVTNVTLASSGSVSNAPVGSYDIVASGALGAGLTNYSIGYSNATLTVNVAGLLITAASTNKIYGATLNPAGYTATGLLAGDSVTNVTLASSGSVSNAPVGSYDIVASAALGAGLTNYTIGYSNGTLAVNSAGLLITAASTNKIYGATLNPVDYAVTGLLNGDTVTNVTLASAGSVSNAAVGGYAISASGVSGAGLTNYNIGYSNGTLTVNAAGLLVTAGNTNKTYGATLNPAAFTVTGLLNGNTVTNVTLTSSGSVSNAAVGGHPIIASGVQGAGLTNYSISYSNGTLTVNVAGLVITAGNTNKVYGAMLNATGFAVAGLLNGDSVTNVTLSSAGSGSNAPVGGYAINASGALGLGLTNYTIGYSNGTLAVGTASLLITAGNTNKIYGTTLNPTQFTATGLLNDDSVTNVTLTSSGSVSNAAVGSYAINPGGALGVGLTNYSIGYSNGTLSVNAAGLLVTAGNTNKTYGATLNPTQYTVTGLLNGDTVTNVTLTSSGSVSNAAMGSYPINASAALGVGLANYSLGYSNGTLTVNVAALLVTALNTNKVYGATLNATGFAVAGLLNGDSVTNVTLSSAGSGSNAPVGSYAIIASAAQGAGLTNYTIGYSNGALVVNAAGLLIAAHDTNKVYGATLNPAGCTISGLLNADAVTNVTLVSAGSISNAPVGSYAIIASAAQGVGLTNYTIGYSNGTLAVGMASLLLTPANMLKFYGTTQNPTVYSVAGLLNGDTVTNVVLSCAGAETNAPVGSYSITASSAQGVGLTNYAITYNVGMMTVDWAYLTVTPSGTNKAYGTGLTPTGYTVSGLLNNDSVTNVTLASAGAPTSAPVGSYPITIGTVVGLGLSNYVVLQATGVLAVTSANLTVLAANTNKVYGTTLNPAEFAVAGLMNGDSVTNVTLSSAGSVSNAAVGGYAISVSGALGLGLTNYSIGYSNGTLTVNTAGLLITAASTNKIYGATLNPVEFTVAGLVNGDSVTNVTLASSGSVSNAPVGNHAITAGGALGAGLTNYSIGYSNGTLTVLGANLTVTAGNTNKVYGNSASFTGAEFSVAGLMNGDSMTNVALASAGTVSNAPVGSYSITVSGAQGTGLTNYAIFYSFGLLNVGAAPLTITAHETNKAAGVALTFTGTEFTAAGLLNADNVTGVNLSSAGAAAGAAAGTYPISATNAAGSGLTNYAVVYVNGTLTVTNAGALFKITSITVTGGVATITWNSVSNQTYVLQYKDDLAGTNWIEVASTILASGPSTSRTNLLGGAPQRFYRVRLGTATEAVPPAPAPQITAIVPTGGEVVVTWSSVAGHFYRLQYNDDLTTTNWADVLPEVTAAGATSSATNSVAGVDKRFYRVWLRE